MGQGHRGWGADLPGPVQVVRWELRPTETGLALDLYGPQEEQLITSPEISWSDLLAVRPAVAVALQAGYRLPRRPEEGRRP